jgi:hypothetical protein
MTNPFYADLPAFNALKKSFVVSMLQTIMDDKITHVPANIPLLMRLTIERLQEIGIGGGYA